MSVHLNTMSKDAVTWEYFVHPSIHQDVLASRLDFWPYALQGAVRAQYLQKCRDTVSGLWMSWVTNFVDAYGAQYPGTGFSAATYRIISIVYDREVL